MDAKTAENSRAYRQALGCFATGVAIVTVDAPEGAWAITVNSFTSVSLSPPLVAWSLGDDSDRYGPFAGAARWGVNVLASDQEAVSARFATNRAPPAGAEEIERLGGSPVLRRALARFDCRTVERRHVGDHLMIIGEVMGFDCAPGGALTYFRGRYGAAPDPEA